MVLSKLPPLNALRAFAAFNQAGSMANAGALLNVSHAAISQQIKALEDFLGLSLLDRQPRRPVLTDQGHRLAQVLDQAFGDIADVVDQLTGAEADRPVQVSVTPSFVSGWLMPRLGDFAHKYPDVSLMIDPSANLKPLEPGAIDVALRYGDGNWPGLESQLLVASPIVVVAAPELIQKEGEVTAEDLTHVHWLQELGTHESSQWLSEHGVKQSPGYRMTSMPGDLMIEAARQGHGVAVVAGALVLQDVAAGRLKVLFESRSDCGYHIVTRPGNQRPAVKAFLKWLRSQAAE